MRELTILVPLYNETNALSFSKFYFDNLGISALYALDEKCELATRRLADELGCETVSFRNDRPFIEHGYEALTVASPTDWILRIDCDEVPTPEAVAFALECIVTDDCVCSFERHQVVWQERRFIRPRHERFLPSTQRQYRLFNRRHVTFDQKIHTPGITVTKAVAAPSQAALYHLSWIFLSSDERLKKAARYDACGQRPLNRANQLFSLEYENWDELPGTVVEAQFDAWLDTAHGRSFLGK